MIQKKPFGSLLPPHLLLITIVAMVGLHFLAPAAELGLPGHRWVGIGIMAAGTAISGWHARLFKRRGTGVVPGSPSTVLVTDGFYKRTRNPMYLGMVIFTVGLGLLLGTLSPLVGIPFILWALNRFAAWEETLLVAAFGAPYGAYRARVRRWI